MTAWFQENAVTVGRDIVGLLAAASIAYGAWMIYAPAGFIVAGGLVLAGVVVAARGDK